MDDPLAHRALDGLLRARGGRAPPAQPATSSARGSRPPGFSVLVVLVTAGGELELRTLRRRLRTSKANATEIVDTLERRGLVGAPPARARPPRGRRHDHRRTAQELVERLFPEHAARVARRVRAARRRREAHARRAVPQARGLRQGPASRRALGAAAAPVPPAAAEPVGRSPPSRSEVLERWRERDVFARVAAPPRGRRAVRLLRGPADRERAPRLPTTCSRACSRTSSRATRRCAGATSTARRAGTATACPSRSRSSSSSARRGREKRAAVERGLGDRESSEPAQQ